MCGRSRNNIFIIFIIRWHGGLSTMLSTPLHSSAKGLTGEVMDNLRAQDVEQRYQFAREVARQAADLAFEFYQQRHQLAVEHKGNDLQDVVSRADLEVEQLTRKLITARYPQDDFLGEESGGGTRQAACTWVVDPIDGTACFLNGLHTWCVSVGVIVNGEPTFVLLYDPNHREMFHACRG